MRGAARDAGNQGICGDEAAMKRDARLATTHDASHEKIFPSVHSLPSSLPLLWQSFSLSLSSPSELRTKLRLPFLFVIEYIDIGSEATVHSRQEGAGLAAGVLPRLTCSA